MQIECTTTGSATQVMLVLLEHELRAGKDFQVDGPNLPDPPICFILHFALPPQVLRQLRDISGTKIAYEQDA